MDGNGKEDLTAGMKAIVWVIFICVVGLFIGIAGLIGHWPMLKRIGTASFIVLVAMIWASDFVGRHGGSPLSREAK